MNKLVSATIEQFLSNNETEVPQEVSYLAGGRKRIYKTFDKAYLVLINNRLGFRHGRMVTFYHGLRVTQKELLVPNLLLLSDNCLKRELGKVIINMRR